jgi:hypothetical protein
MYGSLVYIVCGHFGIFSHFGMFGPRKIWQPWILLLQDLRQMMFLFRQIIVEKIGNLGTNHSYVAK